MDFLVDYVLIISGNLCSCNTPVTVKRLVVRMLPLEENKVPGMVALIGIMENEVIVLGSDTEGKEERGSRE